MKRVFKLLICIMPVFLTVGCTKKTTKEIKPVKIEQFIVQKNNNDKIENYTFQNDKYEKITDNNIKDKYLLYYNEKFNITEYNDGGNIVIQKDDKNIKMPDNTDFVKINYQGSKVFYKVSNGESYSYNIIDVKDNKKTKIDIMLSGNCIDWKNDSTLVYYGIVDNQAALYYYNVNTKEIQMAAKVDKGFVNYLRVIGSNIYYLVNSYDGSSQLVCLDGNSSESLNVEVPYKNIMDLKNNGNTIFIMAESNEKADLYYITNGEIQKVNYDFPKSVKCDTFLYEKDGTIYFIGLDEENNEGLYSFSSDDNEIQLKCVVDGKNHIALNN